MKQAAIHNYEKALKLCPDLCPSTADGSRN
jgi:hypothetical protein